MRGATQHPINAPKRLSLDGALACPPRWPWDQAAPAAETPNVEGGLGNLSPQYSSTKAQSGLIGPFGFEGKVLLHGLVLGLVIVAAISDAAERFLVNGYVEVSPMLPEQSAEPCPIPFSINVSESAWALRFLPSRVNGGGYDYCEASHDGTNIYFLASIQSSVERERSAGRKMAANVANGYVFKGEVLNLLPTLEVNVVWLAYASGAYLRRSGTGDIEPGFAYDMDGVAYGPPQHRRVKAEWTLSNTRPLVPREVTYYSDGYVETAAKGRVRRPSPYDNGFVKAFYKVEAFTNCGAIRIPAVAALTLFAAKPGAASGAEVAAVVTYRAVATNVTTDPDVFPTQPPLPGITAVKDLRSGVLDYLASNHWPTLDQIDSDPYFVDLRRRQARSTQSASAASRTVLRVVCFGLLLIPVFFLLAKRRKA